MQHLDIRKYGFLFVLLISATFIVISCGDEDEDPETCVTTGLTYGNFAEDFINNTCATSGCHDANAIESVGNYETYEAFTTGMNFNKVKGAINHEDGISNMPKGMAQLDSCEIARLSAWIDAGAPE